MSHGEFWSAASALATIAAALLTALSLLFLVIQLREQRRYTLAEFVNGFGKEFAEFGFKKECSWKGSISFRKSSPFTSSCPLTENDPAARFLRRRAI